VAVRGVLFTLALVGALAVGFAVGRSAGPDPTDTGTGSTTGHTAGSTDGMPGMSGMPAGHAHGAAAGADVGGLAVSMSGYTLVAERTSFVAGTAGEFRFRIAGPDRSVVRTFETNHDKLLHLVVVRRDLTGYQHLHPTLAADGTWRVPLTLPTPGVWRAVTDFVVHGGTPLTLGTDLTAAGAYEPVPLPAPEKLSTVDDYTATYDGAPQPGTTTPILISVRRDGKPAPLQRYLGAYGHLVVLREGDLGYLHVHPDADLVDNVDSTVRFWVSAPGPGRYRAFFDFQTGDVVRTAAFTIQVS
jgi:hypothetical protein